MTQEERDLQIAIEKHLSKEFGYSPELSVCDGNRCYVLIEWGDWKHDHLCLDYLMKEIGWTKVAETITEEDGSDCYSSEHTFLKVA